MFSGRKWLNNPCQNPTPTEPLSPAMIPPPPKRPSTDLKKLLAKQNGNPALMRDIMENLDKFQYNIDMYSGNALSHHHPADLVASKLGTDAETRTRTLNMLFEWFTAYRNARNLPPRAGPHCRRRLLSWSWRSGVHCCQFHGMESCVCC